MVPSYCPAPVTLPEFEARLDAAQAAYAELDPLRFSQKLDVTRALLLCLDEPIGRADAAWVHRLEAFDAWLDHDEAHVLGALRSVFAADPAYTFPPEVAPPGNPFTKLVEAARAAGPGSTAPFDRPDVRIDGIPAMQLPQDRPYILQVVAGREVTYTAYLQGGAEVAVPFPSQAVAAGGVAQGSLPASTAAKDRSYDPRATPWLVGAGTSALLAGAAYGLALSSRSAYDNAWSGADLDELRAIRDRTNGSVVVSGVLGVAAVGLGAVGVAVAW
jgi:hypothetical protein